MSLEALLNPAWIWLGYVLAMPSIWSKGAPNALPTWAISLVVAVSLLAWWHGANQAKKARIGASDNAARDAQFKDLVQKLAEKSALPISTHLSDNVDLKLLNNAELRERALAYAQKMRGFEAERKRRSADDSDRHSLHREMTEDQRRAEWKRMSSQMLRRLTDETNEFRARILPEALAIETELLRKLGKSRPRDCKTGALESGMLAGVTPVADAADYIELLAREL